MVKKEKINKVIINIILFVVSLTILIPLWMMFVNSFKTPGEALALGLGLPEKWMFDNYYNVFVEGRLFRGLLNSCLITFCSVMITLFIGSMASFIIARRKTKLTMGVKAIIVAGMVAPPQMVTTVKVLQFLNLHGTYLGVILFYSGLFLPFVVFLMSEFAETLPVELDESAMMDGASRFIMFTKIIMPLLKPIYVTTFVLVFMFVWNDFNYPLYLFKETSTWTIPMSVYNFTSAYGNKWNYVFADLIMASAPVIIVYIFAQKHIIRGLTAGAVKG